MWLGENSFHSSAQHGGGWKLEEFVPSANSEHCKDLLWPSRPTEGPVAFEAITAETSFQEPMHSI